MIKNKFKNSVLLSIVTDNLLNFESQLEMPIVGTNAFGSSLQFAMQLLVIKQLVDGVNHLLIREFVGVKLNAIASFVHSLAIVDLVGKVGQHDHGLVRDETRVSKEFTVKQGYLSEGKRLRVGVISAMRDDQVHMGKYLYLWQMAFTPQVARQTILGRVVAFREDALVVCLA